MPTSPNPVRRFFTDKHGKVVIAQFPNLPLITWFVFTLIAYFVHAGLVHTISHIGAGIALAVWSLMEIIWGASPFRRTLGGTVLLLLILSLLRTL